jgi:glycosyltransferase involved in cell wall biosynthesis
MSALAARHGARLLFVDHSGVMGGAEHSLLDLLPAFAPQAEVQLLADGPFRAEVERHGVPVHVDALGASASVRKTGGLPSFAAVLDVIGAARRLARRAEAFDLLYANSQKAFVISAIAGWLARRPVVWHLRDILGPPHFSGLSMRVAIWLANQQASVVIANSRATADAFVAMGGRTQIVRVVHNGIDAAPFDAVTRDTARALRRDLGASEAMPLVVHVGRFHPWKGQQVLLRALALEPRAQAWIVGAPLFGENAFGAELRALSTSLGLDSRVRFLGLRDGVPALLKAADIVVHSSVYPEPFGRVVVEGMLAGRPVIAADDGGVTEIISNEKTGLLVSPDDVGALAGAIGRLIEDPALATAIAAQGAAHARHAFTRDAMVRGVIAAVESIAR